MVGSRWAGPSIGPTVRERVGRVAAPGWARAVLLRRVAAALLVVLAGVLAVRGDPAGARSPVLVAAHDLAPGQVLAAADLEVRRVDAAAVPAGAVRAPEVVAGRAVVGAVRAGEPITDVRVVGPALVAAATGVPDAVAVPVRLADVAVAELLRPGDRVVVVRGGAGTAPVEGSAPPPRVVAPDATVLLVAAPESRTGAAAGRLVVLALPGDQASAVASASLDEPLTVTVR